MWSWMKYLYLAIRLGTLWENLKAVAAGTPGLTSAAYDPAAAVILEDPKVQRWLGHIPPEDVEKFRAGLPVFLWGLDAMTE